MMSTLKYFVYILGSALVVLGLIKFVELPVGEHQVQANVFEWEKTIDIYFANGGMGSNDDCSLVFPVSRRVPNAETFGPAAIGELLKGVQAEEREQGYSTNIPEGVLLQSFEIQDNVAYVDLSSRLSEIAGACSVQSIYSQIETTLNNLPDIDRTVISVNGETEGILEP